MNVNPGDIVRTPHGPGYVAAKRYDVTSHDVFVVPRQGAPHGEWWDEAVLVEASDEDANSVARTPGQALEDALRAEGFTPLSFQRDQFERVAARLGIVTVTVTESDCIECGMSNKERADLARASLVHGLTKCVWLRKRDAEGRITESTAPDVETFNAMLANGWEMP